MLQEGPRGIAELYNDFCARRQLWGFALEMVALAHYTDRAWIQDLWDVYLRQVRAFQFYAEPLRHMLHDTAGVLAMQYSGAATSFPSYSKVTSCSPLVVFFGNTSNHVWGAIISSYIHVNWTC